MTTDHTRHFRGIVLFSRGETASQSVFEGRVCIGSVLAKKKKKKNPGPNSLDSKIASVSLVRIEWARGALDPNRFTHRFNPILCTPSLL